MNHMKYAPLAAVLLNFWLPFDLHAGSCVWDPSGGSIAVDADVQVSAWPGDPAPDTGEFCDCDDEDNPVNWSPTGNYSAPLSGAVSGGKLDTSTPGSKTVTANISYEYSCSVTGAVKWEDDDGNPWDKTFYVENYWIEGPSSVGKDEPASYEVKTNTGTPPNVTNWGTSGGSLSGSGASVSVTWSDAGIGKTVTATVDQYGDVFTFTDVIGDLVVGIDLPDSNPYIGAKDVGITFRAKDPIGGSGQYAYKWDFGKGDPKNGGVTQKEVSGVVFGEDAEGSEHTVKLILTDLGQSNSGTATVNVIIPEISVWPEDDPDLRIRYFFGETPGNYPTTIKLKAWVEPELSWPSFSWYKITGGGKYSLSVSIFSQDTVLVESLDKSANSGDCKVRAYLKPDEKAFGEYRFTIDWVNGAVTNGPPVDKPYTFFGNTAYVSEIPYKLTSRFGAPMTRSIEYNEEWTGAKTNPTSNTWGIPNEGTSNTAGNINPAFRDFISAPFAATPTPSAPGSPLGTSVIDQWPGKINVGSGSRGKGAPAVITKWTRYIDHARHQ